MLLLTLLGAFCSFWGFFGWYAQHEESRLRWLVLFFSFANLVYFGQVWSCRLVDGLDAGVACLIGALALVLCYKR